MLIVVEHGRLGNQLFQLTEVISIKRRGERVVLVGDWADSLRFLPLPGVLHIRLRRTWKIFKTSQTFVQWLVRFFGFLYVHSDQSANPSARFRIVLLTGYFQEFSESQEPLMDYLKCFSKRFQELSESQNPSAPYFVCHARRADYQNWPSAECPAILSEDWYREACEDYRSFHQDNIRFLIISDDDDFGHKLTKIIPNSQYQNTQSAKQVVEIIAQSEGGVISPSSIAWWGGYLGSLISSDKRFLAPHYWAGHRCARWHPTDRIRAPFLDFRLSATK
jgi:hypothetical protein